MIRLTHTESALKKPLSETQIQKQILDYLKKTKVFHFRVNTGGLIRHGRWVPSPNTTKGVCDIVVIKKAPDLIPVKNTADISYILVNNFGGRFIGIEVKSLKGKQSPDQKLFQENVEKNGGIYIIARSVNDVRAVLERI